MVKDIKKGMGDELFIDVEVVIRKNRSIETHSTIVDTLDDAVKWVREYIVPESDDCLELHINFGG